MIRRPDRDSLPVGRVHAISRDERAQMVAATQSEVPDVAQLVRDHSDDVYRIVARLLGPATPAADVEDLTQQVFVAAHDSRHRFRGEARVTTWLYGIASRIVLRYLRSWHRHRRMLDALEAAVEVDAPSVTTPEQAVGDRQLLRQVWACLLRIKPKKRVVYILHEVEGLSVKEIAASLEANEATIWSRLHHARRELDRALDARKVQP